MIKKKGSQENYISNISRLASYQGNKLIYDFLPIMPCRRQVTNHSQSIT